jgi:hypothetical protein
VSRATLCLAAASAALASACVTHERGMLAAVSTEALPHRYEVVAPGVEGRNCRAPERGFRVALDAAVAQAAGANALVDASYHFEKLCLVVRGTAVRVAPAGR